MLKMKDPYDFIEWNPYRDKEISISSVQHNEVSWKSHNPGRMSERWLRRFYDLIRFCVLITTMLALLRLLFNC
jgi:hypothetical protein